MALLPPARLRRRRQTAGRRSKCRRGAARRLFRATEGGRNRRKDRRAPCRRCLLSRPGHQTRSTQLPRDKSLVGLTQSRCSGRAGPRPARHALRSPPPVAQLGGESVSNRAALPVVALGDRPGDPTRVLGPSYSTYYVRRPAA